MEKYITDERTGLQYELVGDYYLLAEEDEPEDHSPEHIRADGSEFLFLIFLKRNLKVSKTFGRYNDTIK